jgi:predicted HTH domain antitoxin
MDLMEIQEYLSDSQKLSILLLSSNLFEPLRGKLWYQKELFLIAKNIPQLEEEIDFEEDFLGPYSEIADSELEQLRTENIIEKRKLRLTAYGREIAKLLAAKASEKLLQLISDIKSFLNNLTNDELLGFIYFSYPEFTTESLEFERIKKNRIPISISLFEKRKISLGKAAEIAGISQEELIRVLEDKGIPVFSK